MSKSPVTAALLAALSLEVQPFLHLVQARRLQGLDWPVWEFACKRAKGVVVLSGMGEGAAGRSAAWILDYYEPEVFISLGFGGAVTPELPPGALVLGETFWRYEPEAGELRKIPAPPCPAAPAGLVERLRTAGLAAFLGSIVTTPVIIHKAKQGSSLHHLVHPVLDLETSAAALAAKARDLPFLSLRAITDAAGEEIPDFLRQAAQEESKPTVGMALAWLAADPRRLPMLVRLWRRSRLAALHLAQALEVVLDIL